MDLSIDEPGMVERGELQAACQKVLMDLLAGLPPLPAEPVPNNPLRGSATSTSSIPVNAPFPQTSSAETNVAVEAAKIRGNAAFSSGDFKKAISHYNMAIRISIDGERQAAQSSALAVLYSNRSAANSGLKYFGKALDDAEEAIKLDPG